MEFEVGSIYHVYNQGNNKNLIFFKNENYHFFIDKMKQHLLPYCDLLAYCLMPNHFHWLIVPNKYSAFQSKGLSACSIFKLVAGDYSTSFYKRELNHQIGILLSSYAQAINKQEGRTGSLFRSKTKSKNGIIEGFVTVDDKKRNLFFLPENNYAATCFEYIHENPVKSGLVNMQNDWEFSSSREYSGLKKSGICNKTLAKELDLF